MFSVKVLGSCSSCLCIPYSLYSTATAKGYVHFAGSRHDRNTLDMLRFVDGVVNIHRSHGSRAWNPDEYRVTTE
eukprot:4075977-Amphidinium_carterae.1